MFSNDRFREELSSELSMETVAHVIVCENSYRSSWISWIKYAEKILRKKMH